MKKIIISMLAVAALASCSKSEIDTAQTPDGLVPIKLNSGIAMSTRAPITTSETVKIGIWEKNGTVDYTATPVWTPTASVSVSADAAEITLSPICYYNAENSIKSYLKGWFPAGTLTSGQVTFTNTDGTVDAILSNEVSGSKGTPVTSDMTFKHMTAQLVFKVQKGEGLATDTKIKTIKVKGASLPDGFDLTKASTATDAVKWTVVTETNGLSVPNLTMAVIGGTAAVAGDPVMVKPVADNTTLKLYVETTVDDGTTPIVFDDVAFTTDGAKLEAGKAYTITLTFGQSGITPKANITLWESANGSGTVQ